MNTWTEVSFSQLVGFTVKALGAFLLVTGTLALAGGLVTVAVMAVIR